MDFYKIKTRIEGKRSPVTVVYPDFVVGKTKDLMVRGRDFYAIWDENTGLWSTDEYDVQRIVDEDLKKYANDLVADNIEVRYMGAFSSQSWYTFKKYVSNLANNSKQLDTKVTFLNDKTSKTDYVSKKLPYDMKDGPCESYDEMMSTLYDPDERKKLEWAIGAIIAGDSKRIQKFIVLYGDPGTGKSTVLEIIEKLFEGYYAIFDAKELTGASNIFSTEMLKNNPLVAIQHDSDLSRIEDNTKLNSIVSHENILINEKYKSKYSMRMQTFLFAATNKPVKITDAKAGLIRRLIDVHPSGRKLPNVKYNQLKKNIDFELGAIASHCLSVYEKMGPDYYNSYRPLDMMFKTDPFFNFVEDSYLWFKEEDGISLKAAYARYKEYCNESGEPHVLQQYKFREELKNYFKEFNEQIRFDDGTHVRSYYSGFLSDKFEVKKADATPKKADTWLRFESHKSVLDEVCADCPAQYASKDETPLKKWSDVKTSLKEIDTSKLHYVKVPDNLIVIDFDIKKDGKKDQELNLKEASKWPKTYAELSKSGAGIHLHYFYDGDVSKLSRIYDDNIEIKVFNGNSSLRRKLSKCNDLSIAKISSGLPLKEEKMVDFTVVKNEKAIRTLIKGNLAKKYQPGTKPSIDFISKILEDAYNGDIDYDVTDMRPAILAFAANSTNHSEYCIKAVSKMKFCSENFTKDGRVTDYGGLKESEQPIVFYDVEVFPNLFLINWMRDDSDNVVRMINPKAAEVEDLISKYRLIGFNNRRYDNHIIYASMMGYTNEQLFKLSQRIINGSTNCMFMEAYNISYADVYDFCSVKQSLKKWEIQLGIHHQELGLPWDQPVPKELWTKVAEYCDNDVRATKAVFHNREADFIAREILADISGLSINDTTRLHTTKIIFGNEQHPDLKYTDLSKEFPGYKFENGKSSYMDEDPGEGGYVYSEPGMYTMVALLDIASMHPTSIVVLNLFGSYTVRFEDILKARLYIKHKEFDKAKKLLGGALAPYLTDEAKAEALAQALKIVINSVYGYTTATFANPFKDERNVDNIVAKRGALFMINLKHEVQKRGFKVAHIKTDSIKIPNATPEIIKFVMDYGKKYGYTFEHEATYEKMCLVNDAVYIAKYYDGKHAGEWTATGTQFQVPYVFKTLFSKEPIEFEDMCETKSVSTNLYLDMNEKFANDEHDYHFVGKVGLFCPIKSGRGGGELLREKDGKYYAATGTKGYRWLESEMVKVLKKEDDIDKSYYERLVNEAIKTISQYGDFEWFVADDKAA